MYLRLLRPWCAAFARRYPFRLLCDDMTAIRRYVRAVAMTWLLCQAASLSAFVPEQCCVSHAAEAVAKEQTSSEACHEAPPAEPKEGDACPMHQGGQKSHDCCVMTNACDGPGTHLTRLLAFVALPEAPQSAPITLEASAIIVTPAPPPLVRISSPDAPPPKA